MATTAQRSPEFYQREADGQLRIALHAGQARVWSSEKRFVFMIAGTQSGKTTFGPLWLWREWQQRGQGDYLAITSTFPLLKLKMLPEFLRLWEQTLKLGTWHAVDKYFAVHDGSRIIFGSATNPESLESATAKAAWLDECGQKDFRLEAWEAVQRRLSLHQGRALGTTTPYNRGWLLHEIMERWREGVPDIEVVQFASTMNPAFPQVEFERMKDRLPAWKFNMFYRGQFDRPEGLIYGTFVDSYREDGGHKVHPLDLPPEWPRYVGVDFGAINTALVWIAEDPQAKVYYLYRESLDGGRTTAEHAAQAKALSRGMNVVSWRGGAKSEHQSRWDWEREGIPLREPSVVDVEAGIDRVVQLWKERRLFVFDSCKGVLDELGTYSREIGPDGQPTETIADKETFHRLDALRYCVQGFTDRSQARIWL